jgi:exopolysaccharide biosynthesis polyprenyl glycosylphosphotransferase
MKKSEIILGALRVPVDYFAVFVAFLLAYYIRPITDLIPGIQFKFGPELLPPFADYIWLAGVASLFLVAMFAFNHLYSIKLAHRFGRSFLKIGFLVTAWMMFIISYYFLVVHQLFFSRIALLHIWFFSIVFITSGRVLIQLIQYILLKFGIGRKTVLFIGAGPLADRFYDSIKKDSSYEIIGALNGTVYSKKIDELKIIGAFGQLESIVKKYKVGEIIMAEPQLAENETRELHAFCRNHQITYHFIPDLVKLQSMNVEVEMIDNIPLVSLKDTSLDEWGYVFKRIFDFAFSLILIIVLIPVWIIIAVIIRIDSRGPVFYKGRRKYKDKIFGIYKFRTMVKGADLMKKELLQYNERTGPLFKIKDDPRITRVGKFLRKTSLDELPQLINVLIGNMSLVGPRPHIPEEIEQYDSHHYQVFALKPGLTGLAQISGRSNLDFEEEVKLDVYYIENWSLWLDLKIILKSIAVIFRADGS